MKTFDWTDLKSQKEFILFVNQRGTDFSNIEKSVQEILASIRQKGDTALLGFTKKFDQATLNQDQLEVTQEELKEALEGASEELKAAIELAKKNVSQYYNQSKKFSWEIDAGDGAKVGELWHPLKRVGVYIPSGTAPLISTILMTVVPAKVAGVEEVIALTPPNKDGDILPEMLAAFALTGVDRVFRAGGAQAIGALAYGTETIPRVDKIVGPGNQYVTAAKKIVFGDVGIDTLAGPSEVLIVADQTASAEFLASDLLSQLEHDIQSQAILVSPDADLLEETQKALKKQMKSLDRQDQIQESCANGAIFVKVSTLTEAVEVANLYGPEHCEVAVEKPEEIYRQIQTAGALFIGNYSPVATGDFVAGPSHVLPTGGAGRFSAGLSLDDFMKRTSVIHYSQEALKKVRGVIQTFTQIEGLDAHQKSVDIRFEGKE